MPSFPKSAARKILMACLHYWNSPFQVATHHLARRFAAAGWQVAYVSAPITPWHLLKGLRDNLQERFALYATAGMTVLDERLWAYTPLALIAPDNRPLLRNHWILNHWAKTTLPSLRNMVATRGFAEVDLLYLDNFYHHFWLDAVRYRKSVYHMADHYSAFSGYSTAFATAEATLVHRVNLLAYPSQSLKNTVRAMQPQRMALIPNGVDYQYFQTLLPRPAAYRQIHGAIAVYVGALAEWFDFGLLQQVAQRLSQVSFILIGPNARIPSSLTRLSNVHALGLVGPTDLPAYLQHADVGLIPFDVVKHQLLLDPVRPLKLLEYFACGLPVVATTWAELRSMNSPAILTDSAESFAAAIEQQIATPPDPTLLRQYARNNDWMISFQKLLADLELA